MKDDCENVITTCLAMWNGTIQELAFVGNRQNINSVYINYMTSRFNQNRCRLHKQKTKETASIQKRKMNSKAIEVVDVYNAKCAQLVYQLIYRIPKCSNRTMKVKLKRNVLFLHENYSSCIIHFIKSYYKCRFSFHCR